MLILKGYLFIYFIILFFKLKKYTPSALKGEKHTAQQVLVG